MQEPHPLQQPAYPTNSTHALDQIQAELKQQRVLIEQNHALLVSLRRQARMSTMLSILRLLLILIPLILALFFLPPIIREWLSILNDYQESFSVGGRLPEGLDIGKIQDLLKNTGVLER